MLTFFYDQDDPLLIDFLQRGTTVNAQRYSQTGLRIICLVAWCGSGFDSENEPNVVETLTYGYAVKSSELVYMTKSQGNEQIFLNNAVRM